VFDFRARGSGRDAAGRRDPAPPSRLLTASEVVRFPAEYASGWLLDRWPARDLGLGRPVLLLPGFGASARTTDRLRSHLDLRGWTTYAWQPGPDRGLTDEVVDGVLSRLDEVHVAEQHPVDVVGWSSGGLLARWLGHQRPCRVRSVVTLGSPFRPDATSPPAPPMSQRAGTAVDQLRGPLPVPTTAIWSKTDGIVGWRGCRVEESETARNVSVPSSHLGMTSNPFALAALTRALVEP
jgi:pimeloyl-ACP methyl ester carboxylesterase